MVDVVAKVSEEEQARVAEMVAILPKFLCKSMIPLTSA
jgi:hypothetical protein